MDPKIIVRMPNWLGDVIMAIPVLVDLRSWLPRAQITVICSASYSEVLQDLGLADSILSFSSQRGQKRQVIAKISQSSHDIGLLLTNSFSSAWSFWKGGVKRRIGYKKDLRSLFLTESLPMPPKTMHQVERYKQLITPLGIPVTATTPRLWTSEVDRQYAQNILIERGYRPGNTLIGINPGAAFGSAKCWPLNRFRQLIEKLVKNRDHFVVLFGDNGMRSLCNEISIGLSPRVMNLAGATTLKELVGLISICSVLVTNDSGPMHVAAALGTPIVALFGSTDERVTSPTSNQAIVINKRVSCAPCLRRTCPTDFSCMRMISVEEVFDAVDEMRRDV